MALNPDLKIDEASLITSTLIKKHKAASAEAVDAAELKARAAQLALVLDLAHQAFARQEPAGQIVERLAGRLHELRREVAPALWQELIPLAQQHRVAAYLKQDPFTRWSFEKPRGYSGDATLLDIYYKHPSAAEIVASSSELGREIFAYTSEAASSVAGRERREILAKTVDETAARVENAEVLAIACGHLREAELSKALAERRLKRWIGLDQDPVSVGTVNRDLTGTAVEAVDGSVRGLLRRAYPLGTFDLVYASGLYDYLPLPVGARLLQRAMELVKPDGEFLFANFSDEITTDGYMETFMDWPLILRSAGDMWDIINAAVDKNRVEAEVYYGSNRNIVYGKIRKRVDFAAPAMER
ncbi:class I SAM-dependent methyltransferase [Mesorhizobium sp.]|uniref:class I SAM-dependent methyltransferase n=1 Tax=Mesorhizobium sp. TaxID=1871066 RepID=UPI000FE7AC9F|nr:class I SAM-dependent methyltransferase [Mesorhizobium sp.]WIE92164.1 class I SAM-dependent methyltransferase [Mesorhizobium sp. WSM4875]RWG00903.1 MAG: methyltransferase domain-containing protein [Mesorhizobium sp.]RWG54560.1 MAG: methyltransferase domain-containing protein [Mesorhizobium sp.]RWG98204.1 MAG: methyltransferase domain-containing protein [Mesorhizobium sp.]RWH41576.1 MAG: methyltransferase domain-containing protein [Mesorhizobium sp.]